MKTKVKTSSRWQVNFSKFSAALTNANQRSFLSSYGVRFPK